MSRLFLAMLVIITGASKSGAVQQWRRGAPLPIARVADPVGARVILERDCLSLAHDQASVWRQEIQ